MIQDVGKSSLALAVQAFVNKHTGGGNRQLFAPDSLRDLAPSEKLGAEPAMYVKLEGLGKIAYSNVRRPRPLMDLVADSAPAPAEDSPSVSIPAAIAGCQIKVKRGRW